jgi:hypothetical protein
MKCKRPKCNLIEEKIIREIKKKKQSRKRQAKSSFKKVGA